MNNIKIYTNYNIIYEIDVSNIFSLYKYKNDKLIYSSKCRNNRVAKNVYFILDNINKLSEGKIKKYQIFNKLELEFICNHLSVKKILHTIMIKLKNQNKWLCNTSYDNFKNTDKYNIYFTNLADDIEYNYILRTYDLYIVVYKGFVNLTENYSQNIKYKFKIYI